MGLKCRISYSNGVAQVIDERGNESQLYNDLLAKTGNEAIALDQWIVANDERLMNTGENTSIEDIEVYLDGVAASTKSLSPAEEFQVADFMRRTGERSLDELNIKLSKIFKADGVFNIDIEEAVNSGLFTQQEIEDLDVVKVQDILSKIEGQLALDDIIVETEERSHTYVNADNKTIFGTAQKISQREFDNEIIRAVDSFTNKETFLKGIRKLPYTEFVQKVQDDEAYADSIMEKFNGLSKIPKLSVVGNTLSDENNELHTTIRNTVLVKDKDVSVEAEIDYLNGIPQDVWEQNLEDTKEILKEVEQTLADINIDVVGISNSVNNREGVMKLLYSADALLKQVGEVTLKDFVESHKAIIETPNTIIAEKLEDKYKGLNVVSFHTNKSANFVFNNYGLIEIDENLYHKVDQKASLDVIKDYIYGQVVEGDVVIPSSFITVKDITDSKNKPKVLEGISAYLMSRPVTPQIANKELYSAYQVAFNHSQVENREKSTRGLVEIKTDEKYLKTEFISDFYNYILKEKVKDSIIYKNILSKFQINDRGIILTESVQSIDNLEYSKELKDYIRLHRDSNMKYLVDTSDNILSEDLLFLNFPEKLIEFEGPMIIDGNFVITNTTVDNFIKVGNEVYRKEIVREGSDLFVKITTPTNSTYLTRNLDFSFDRKAANELFNDYAMLSPTAVSNRSFQTVVAKSRLNDNMGVELKELSTLKDKSYIFTEVGNSVIVHKDGKEVGSITYSKENGVYANPKVTVDEMHRSKGIGTELYLQLFNKAKNEGATVLQPAEETLQSKNIFERIGEAVATDVHFQQGNKTEVIETPKQVLDAVISKLKSTELADNVYSMSAEALKEEMSLMGIGVITVNQVINEEEVSEEGLEELKEAGVSIVPNGFVHQGTVFLNTDAKNLLNTQIHEFGHLFNAWAKKNRPDIYKKGVDLIRSEEGKPYIDFVKKNQPNLEGEALQEEALTQAIGDRGQKFVEESARKSFLEWLSELWDSVRVSLGIRDLSTNQVQKLDLEGFARAVATDMLKGNTYSTTAYTIQPLLDEMLANKAGKMVSVQTIQQVLKQKGVKQIEKDIINEVLELEGFKGQNKIPFDSFKVEVNMRIMPLTVIESTSYSDYGNEKVGVDVGWHTTNIYNTDLDHQIKGHFTGDFNVGSEASRFEIRDLQNGTYAVVREGVVLTEENIQDNVVHATPDFESAENWIANFNKANAINQGMFGHTRVWRESGSRDVFVAEVQSDSYQNMKAENMLFKSYENNNANMTEEQKLAFDKYNNAVDIIEAAVKADQSNPDAPYRNVQSLSKDISDVMAAIRKDEERLKEATDNEPHTKKVYENNLKKKRLNLDSYMKLATGKPVTLVEGMSEGEFILPYNILKAKANLNTLAFTVNDEMSTGLKSLDMVVSLNDLSKGIKVEDAIKVVASRLSGKSKEEVMKELALHEEAMNNARNNREYEGASEMVNNLRDELVYLRRGLDKTLNNLKNLPENAVIKSTASIEYRLSEGTVSKENNKWVDGKYVNRGNLFDTPQEALDYYNANIKPVFDVKPEEYAAYFNAGRNVAKYKKEILDKASIKDKQFLAHRKNYSERLLREEIRSNAEKGMETLSIPTPRTLSLIEGYTSEDGEGSIPYVIDGREEGEDSDLKEGDTIEFQGSDYTVVVADSYDIEVVQTSSVHEVNGDEMMNEMAENDVVEAMYSFDKLIKEKTLFTASEWQNWVSDEDYNISSLEIEEVADLEATDEDGDEVYLINRSKAEDNIRMYSERSGEDIESFMNDIYQDVWYVGDGVYFVSTESNVYTEALKQPDQYEEVSIEDFDINDMTSTEQTVLRKYEVLIETFRGENPETETIKDSKGNEWVRMKLTNTEAENPITVFQIGDNLTARVEESIENTSSIFDSRLELLDLYSSKEEAQIKKDTDCG